MAARGMRNTDDCEEYNKKKGKGWMERKYISRKKKQEEEPEGKAGEKFRFRREPKERRSRGRCDADITVRCTAPIRWTDRDTGRLAGMSTGSERDPPPPAAG